MSPLHWITSVADVVTKAKTAARHTKEDRENFENETSAVLETAAYGLLVLALALLGVLLVTPTN